MTHGLGTGVPESHAVPHTVVFGQVLSVGAIRHNVIYAPRDRNVVPFMSLDWLSGPSALQGGAKGT